MTQQAQKYKKDLPLGKYVCPYCGCSMLESEGNHELRGFTFSLREGNIARLLEAELHVCSNPDCGKSSLHVRIKELPTAAEGNIMPMVGQIPYSYSRRLFPPAGAHPVPACVPPQIAQDYMEACEIVDASPKAAATLTRRCLQGMIRDFWGVSRNRLCDEIEAIRDRIDPETWDAIDSIRKIGNIGAHMEKDINLIIDVEPQEAELLIGLVESLFDEWYVAREKRQKRNMAIIETAKRKEEQRHPDKLATETGKQGHG